MRELFLDLLLPETDQGAVIQWVVMAVFWLVVAYLTRRWRQEHRLFVGGLAMLNIAWFAARTLH